MTKMSKKKKLLVITIFAVALVQMPMLALMPAIERMANVFTDRSLSEIQTVVSLPNLISMFMAIMSAILITKGVISKRAAVVAGLCMAFMTGFASIFLHTQFWHLIVFSVMLGTAMGFFIPTATSVMFDAFTADERQSIAGCQTACINIGGILMSAIGGSLATLIWYGGYLAFLLMIPVAVLAAVTLPGDKLQTCAATSEAKPKKTKMPVEAYYYAALIFLFMMVNTVCGSNLSTHLAANNLGNSGTAGIASAIQMAGGVASGLVFSKLSMKFRDYMISFAFLAIFLGLTILNIGQTSLAAAFVGVFIVGSSMSMIIPQSLLSVSKCVDPTNSSATTTLVSCFAPGAGAFLSPVIFTNLTMRLGGDSTSFRYQFVGIVALIVAVGAVLATMHFEKKASGALPVKD